MYGVRYNHKHDWAQTIMALYSIAHHSKEKLRGGMQTPFHIASFDPPGV